MDAPFSELTRAQQNLLLNARTRGFKGVIPFLRDLETKRYKQYIRVFLRQYQTAQECPECGGSKLQPEALNVRVGGKNIAEVSEMPVDELRIWLNDVRLSDFEQAVAATVLDAARRRVNVRCDVGLTYLSMYRPTPT